MISNDWYLLVLDVSGAMTTFAINWLLQSTLLISVGLVAAILFRKNGSAAQSAVYRTTLVAVMACPLVGLLLASGGIEGWSLQLPPGYAYATVIDSSDVHSHTELANSDNTRSASSPVGFSEVDGESFSMNSIGGELVTATSLTSEVLGDLDQPGFEEDVSLVNAAGAIFTDHLTAETVAESEPLTRNISAFGGVMICFAICWVMLTVLFTVRLLFMVARTRRLRNGAVEAADDDVALCREIATKMDVPAPLALRAPFITSPRLHGLRQPAVILPEDLELPLADVFVHELAHLRRHDCYWLLARQLAVVVLFYQPLLWWLAKRIDATAEEVCDDYVVQMGGNRATYANSLVDIAAQSLPSTTLAGVGMVSLRSMLGHRVGRIMNTSRSLSTCVGNLLMLLVIVGGLISTTIAGFVGLASPSSSAVAVSPSDGVKTDEQAENESTASATDAVANSQTNNHRGEFEADATSLIANGRVIGPDGNSVNGAEIWFAETVVGKARWAHQPLKLTKWVRLGKTGSGGQFKGAIEHPAIRAAVIAEANPTIRLAATADGFGWAWTDVKASELMNSVSLKLIGDIPIEGRILTIMGKPAVGVKLRVNHILPDVNIDGIIKSAAGSSAIYTNSPLPPFNGGGPKVASVVTDSNGRFRIDGMGVERSVRLEAMGGGIGAFRLNILTRPTPAALKPHGTIDVREGLSESTCYASFTHIATLERMIRGIVTDEATGVPIRGVRVSSESSWQALMNPVTTDSDGRFEVHGRPKMSRYRPLIFEAIATQHFNREVALTDPPGLEPIVMDVSLPSGIIVKGRLTDQHNGQPLEGTVTYSPLAGNTYCHRIADLGVANPASTSVVGPDGNYEICVLPGPGAITAKVSGNKIRYASPTVNLNQIQEIVGVDIAATHFEGHMDAHGKAKSLSTQAGAESWGSVGFFDKHAVALLNPAEETKELTVDLGAIRGHSIDGTIVDSKGLPVSGVKVFGLGPVGEPDKTLDSDEFTVTNLSYQKERVLYFTHAGRNLGAHIDVDATQTQPIKVQLKPTGVITGRFVNKLHEPLADIQVALMASPGHHTWYKTDPDGRFTATGVICDVDVIVMAKPLRQPGTMLGLTINKVTVGSGKTLDIGTFTRNDERQYEHVKVVVKAETVQADTNTSADQIQSVTGTVLLPDGTPAAGAIVRASVGKWAILESVVGPDHVRPVSKVTADAFGHFTIHYSKQPYGDLSHLDKRWSEIWKQTTIAASLPGYGGQWVRYTDIEGDDDLKLQLVEDFPVTGQIVDQEGQPVSGLNISIGGPSKSKAEDLTPWLKAAQAGELPWTLNKHTPQNVAPQLIGVANKVTTDNNGRFEIHGLGRERHSSLWFKSETVAHGRVVVVTRSIEPFERMIIGSDWAGRPTESVFGASFTYAAAASRPIVGTVRDAETGEPMAGVHVESYKFADRPISSDRVLKTVTDSVGRFRLIGMPKDSGNRIVARPNDEQPYFIRQVDVPNPSGIGPVAVEIDLHRGVLITGRVTDQTTGKPVHARLHYLPYRSNKFAQVLPEFGDSGNTHSDQMRYQTKPDGTYRLVGLPGPAVIAAESVHRQYRKGVGLELAKGPRYRDTQMLDTYNNPILPSPRWPNTIAEVDIASHSESFEVDFQMQPAPVIQVRTLDSEGQSIRGVKVLTASTSAGTFEPSEFTIELPEKDATSTLMFLKDDLGWVQQISATDVTTGVTVRLRKLAVVTGRLLLADGSPVTGANIQSWPASGKRFSSAISPNATTDLDGLFQLKLPAGVDYTLQVEGAQIEHSQIGDTLSIEAGEAKMLGTLRLVQSRFLPATSDSAP